MAIPDDVAEQLRELARRENRSVGDVLKTLLARCTPSPATTSPAPSDEEGVRRVILKTYARARRYWEKVGDKERLALTDEELDEQFWLIDPDGIPRLKSEQGTIAISPNPLLMMAEAAEKAGWSSDYTDLSEHADEFMRATWPDHLRRKWERNAE
jgi:predicted CopG family antitoxin